MDTRNLREFTNVLFTSLKGKGYLMEKGSGRWRQRRGVGHRNFHLLNKTKERKLLLHICILREHVFLPVEPTHFHDRINSLPTAAPAPCVVFGRTESERRDVRLNNQRRLRRRVRAHP
ncbi:hypothetical protein EVAR_49431_1 [Eumeta japonica]|uniref:Uncharacterized protein n=1 Tax=Eumeta variegata TaxID=151549 RepID=A0A4C1YXT8_EUMVA|nr:hypothetical protein EVAR_49431_1 [Eumeta japonica]